MIRKGFLALLVALAGVTAAQAQDSSEEQPRSMTQSPTLNFVGDRYRIGVGIDTEFDIIGEFQAAFAESEKSALIGEGWLGRKGAGGLKLNYHWLFSGTQEDGANGPVYTDGRIAKLFVAADQNQLDDRKITFGGGYEYQDWFFGLYGMRSISSERLVNRAIDVEDILVTGQIDGRDFTRLDQLERVTELFEKPYDWGAGLRGGRYFDGRLIRLRGGLDYEDGDHGSSQMTASLSLDRYFQNTPHSLSFRTGFARQRGDFIDNRNDFRGSLVYSYSFGRSYRPARAFRETTIEIMPEPRYEERAFASEVTLSDQATFEFDSAALREQARATLVDVVAAIRDGGLIGEIRVVGHTCDIGTAQYNQGLSERRARSVVEFLSSQGIAADEIRSEGRGLTEPRYPNDSEENRSRNRRVEISFTTETSRTERIQVSPDGPVTEVRQVEVAVEAPWIRRALRNPVQHKREVDYYRYQEVTETVTEGEVVLANQPPTANDNTFNVEQDSADNALDVLANDTDPDGDALTIVDVTPPANGDAVISGDVILYTPAAGFSGTDTFTYTIDDGFGGQDSATVTVLVAAANQPPVANPDEFTVEADSSDNALDVLANDSDPDGGPLTLVGVSDPGNGEARISGDLVLYTPAAGFIGTDSFSYTIADSAGAQDSATVTVNVVAANQPPVANDVNVSTPRTQPIDIDVLANDVDPDGDGLEIVSFSQPANGMVTRSGDQLRYQPDQLFFGNDTFEYTISDGRGGEDTATVFVEVVFANQAPVARPDAASGPAGVPITVEVLANDFDPDGDPLEVIHVTRISVAPAEATINDDGTITFIISSTCSGRNRFRYTITDPFGATDSALVDITRTSEDTGDGTEDAEDQVDCMGI
jgi:outer membrane protein OmpA-like peptidoglycan-associated protein